MELPSAIVGKEDLPRGMCAMLEQHLHLCPTLRHLAFVGLCQSLTDAMTSSVHMLLELTARVDDLLQGLELPTDLRDGLRGTVRKAWETAPPQVMTDLIELTCTDGPTAQRLCRRDARQVGELVEHALCVREDNGTIYHGDLTRARNMWRLWGVLHERPIVLVLFGCAIPGDALGADSSATASIVINLGLLRRMARARPLSDFQGPDWFIWIVHDLKRRIQTGEDEEDETWTVLSPLSSEQVIDDLDDPVSWLNVKNTGVEFEESGAVNARRAVYYLKNDLRRMTGAYSYDPLDLGARVERHHGHPDVECSGSVAVYG